MDDVPFHRITIIRPDGTAVPMERRASTSPFRPYGPEDGRAAGGQDGADEDAPGGPAPNVRERRRRRRAPDAAGHVFDVRS